MTLRLSDGFGDFDGRVWLNTAHQGALPIAAAGAAREAIEWKLAPAELTADRFRDVPARLRAALGKLIGAPADDVILANSASYGLHLLANAFPWSEGDEVLVMATDFPSDILPWLTLEKRFGVTVRRLVPGGRVVSPDELRDAIGPRTRVFCTTWVHSFSGFAVDLEGLGTVCHERGVRFVVNASQAIGARPIDVSRAPVDALVSVGFKWLCGPYGTGFCWIRPDLRGELVPIQAYWLAMQRQEDLGLPVAEQKLELRNDLGARGFEIFGTANFFNFVPWTVSVEHVLELGVERIQEHDQALVERFVSDLPEPFELQSPHSGSSRSTLAFFSHRDPSRNTIVYEALARAGIDIASRNQALRLSPHLYNSTEDIDRTLTALERATRAEP